MKDIYKYLADDYKLSKESMLRLMEVMYNGLSSKEFEHDDEYINILGQGYCYENFFKRDSKFKNKFESECSSKSCKECAVDCAKLYLYTEKKNNLGAWE